MEERTPGVWSWLASIILFLIPGINLIYFLILVFGKSRYKSKVNFARACILLLFIMVIAYFATFAVKYYLETNSFDFNGYMSMVKDNFLFIWGKIVEIWNSIVETVKK